MVGDMAYYHMIEDYRDEYLSALKQKPMNHIDDRITVLIRKRPLFQKELNKGELDCISCLNPYVIAH